MNNKAKYASFEKLRKLAFFLLTYNRIMYYNSSKRIGCVFMASEIIIPELNSETIESMIYSIRGQRVMIDFELAKIYGYETKRFNEQVKNNIERFPEKYRFQLTIDEAKTFSRSKKSALNVGRGHNIKYLPYAFTEQGVYMLMTILKGELAVKQSIILIDAFKQMKDYIIESNNLVSSNDLFALINKVDTNTKDIKELKDKYKKLETNFKDPSKLNHFLILDGQRIEADIAYQTIYSLAKKSIYIIDDYIDIKTLQLLKSCKDNVEIIIFSDNLSKNNLTNNLANDFINDTKMNISFRKNNNKFHDRYIILDFNTKNEILYHCGTSSKDSGKRVNTISIIEEKGIYKPLIEYILDNSELLFNY